MSSSFAHFYECRSRIGVFTQTVSLPNFGELLRGHIFKITSRFSTNNSRFEFHHVNLFLFFNSAAISFSSGLVQVANYFSASSFLKNAFLRRTSRQPETICISMVCRIYLTISTIFSFRVLHTCKLPTAYSSLLLPLTATTWTQKISVRVRVRLYLEPNPQKQPCTSPPLFLLYGENLEVLLFMPFQGISLI